MRDLGGGGGFTCGAAGRDSSGGGAEVHRRRGPHPIHLVHLAPVRFGITSTAVLRFELSSVSSHGSGSPRKWHSTRSSTLCAGSRAERAAAASAVRSGSSQPRADVWAGDVAVPWREEVAGR